MNTRTSVVKSRATVSVPKMHIGPVLQQILHSLHMMEALRI